MKKIINLSLIAIMTLCLAAVAKAQYGIIKLSNGVTVVIKTQITPTESKKSLGNIYSSNSGNVINRILTDRQNKIYFGYDLSFEKAEGTGKFKVSIKPLSKTPDSILSRAKMSVSKDEMQRARSAVGSGTSRVSVGSNRTSETKISSPDYSDYTAKSLPNYPEDFIVNDGDTITLDLLENPETNTKITDVIKISSKSDNFEYYFSDDRPVKDFSIEDIHLRIETPDIYINEKKYRTKSTIAGNINWIYIHGKGRFIFSFKPQLEYNFQKIGIIQNNKLSFEYNGDKYEFVSKSPILGSGGKWNLWVMHDLSYQPTSQKSEENPFIFGAAGRVEYLFERR
jgi:hypothetical protein